jgi:hypothetical protein
MPRKRALYLLGLCACLGLAAYTSWKLSKMVRIREHGDVITAVVARKETKPGRGGKSCYLVTSRRRVQVDCDFWEDVHEGQTIELAIVDGEPFVVGGDIYASDGNFVLDVVLLVAECIGAIYFVVLLVRRRPRPHD